MTTVRNEFTMDPNLLVSVIKSQAGSLSKAILEGVMNSIDAGASRVDVTLDRERFTIADNGKGFANEQEILQWFGRFGTPHQEGDAIYGRFRMGRGQLMAYAVTNWRSGAYSMEVDIEHRGMGYDLQKGLPKHKGCLVQGTLYQPLSDYQLTDALTELRQFVAYTPKPVYVNGELYGAPAARLKTWTFEDDEAYYRLSQDQEELMVYNQGVFVERMGNWKTGMGGVIVSKRALNVNFARNSVLEGQCPVWRRILRRLENLVVSKLTHAQKLSDGERKYLARRLAMLPSLGVDALKAKVLTDPSGKHLKLVDLREYRRFAHISGEEALACAAHGTEGTFVVTDKLLTRFGVSTLREWLDRITATAPMALAERYEVLEEDQVSHLGLGGAKMMEIDGLTTRERAAFKALGWLNEQLAERLLAGGHIGEARKLLVGKHKAGSFVAWTDGKTFITANKRYLKLFETGLPGVHEWLLTLVHEYTHDTDDSESHAHGEVFYRKFHDSLFTSQSLGVPALTQAGLVRYLQELSDAGVPRPQALTRQLKPLQS